LRGAEPPQKVDIHEPTAVALGYVERASQVDRKKYPQFVPGSSCENCMQLQGKPGSDYRPCSLFAGRLVSVSGWCTGGRGNVIAAAVHRERAAKASLTRTPTAGKSVKKPSIPRDR